MDMFDGLGGMTTGRLFARRPASRRAVLVDADPDHGVLLLQRLADHGFTVVLAHNHLEALTLIGRDRPELAIFQHDRATPDCDRAVALARMLYPETWVVLTTGNHELAATASDDSPILSRPVSFNDIDRCLNEINLNRSA